MQVNCKPLFWTVKCTISALVLISCSFHTAISYRVAKDEEYAKGDGYIINCEKERNFLVVGTYTPDSWGEDFYYGYLKGPRTDRKVKITKVDLRFPETGDKLSLDTVREQKIYWFTAENLDDIIKRNKKVVVTLTSTNLLTGEKEAKEFAMFRRKHTYPTGHLPHR